MGAALAPLLTDGVDLLKCPQDPTMLEAFHKAEREIKSSSGSTATPRPLPAAPATWRSIGQWQCLPRH